jgi:hypothetical protein
MPFCFPCHPCLFFGKLSSYNGIPFSIASFCTASRLDNCGKYSLLRMVEFVAFCFGSHPGRAGANIVFLEP